MQYSIIARLALVSLLAAMNSTAPGQAPSRDRLLFWESADVVDPSGGIGFGAEVLQPMPELSGWPGGHYAASVPRDENSVWAYSWSVGNFDTPSARTFEIRRASTSDGKTFADVELVLSVAQPNAQGFANIVHRPTDDRMFAFSWVAGELHVWRSNAGGTSNWERLGIAYSGHDAMNIIWHPQLKKFINYQTHLEPWPEKDPDDNAPNRRRVIQFKSSDDGLRWEDMQPAFLKGEAFWRPDRSDDPNIEFYRVAAFPHLGRYAMLLHDYKTDPKTPGKHSRLRIRTEWAISRDGVEWSRPFREINAEQYLGWMPVQGPLVIGDELCFYHHNAGARVPADRVFYVTSDGEGQFVSHPFVMTEGGLFVNADTTVNADSRIEAELLDPDGRVLPGYERARCRIAGGDGRALPLTWNGADDGKALAGRKARLRFYLCDAKLYGVSLGRAIER